MKWQLENAALAQSNAELRRYQGSYILYATRRTARGWDPPRPFVPASADA
jgi:hypothetical protein